MTVIKVGVNTVDLFSGDHIALNVRSDLNDLTLMKKVKRLHEELEMDVVELPANLMVLCPDLFSERTIQALEQYQSNSGLEYTVHLPFRGLDLSSLCRPIATASVSCYKRSIRQLEGHLKLQHYVMHLTEMMLKQVARKPIWIRKKSKKIIARMYSQARDGIREILQDALLEKFLVENIKNVWREPLAIA